MSAPAQPSPAHAAAEAAARRSYGKLVAFLAARTRDVAGAEDALADAFAAALADWPAQGVPRVPEAWLLTVARRRLIDAARKRRGGESAAAMLQWMAELPSDEEGDSPALPDERLGLLFACAHPAIDAGVRAPLMLQTILGFDAAAIASAFLVAPTTMGQRLVRAKAKIRQAGIALRVPAPSEMPERLDSVLDAVYAAYAEAWADADGTDAQRRNLAGEAVWLARLIVSLLPEEPEALGLLSLMLHAEARHGARRDLQGRYVPLASQDTALWNAALIAEAEELLHRASRQGGASGRYQLEAAVQSAHAVRRWTGQADWPAIVQLYDALVMRSDSPVLRLNRAVALAQVQGPEHALAALDLLAGDARLADYQPYWAARAAVLAQCSRLAEADAAFTRAIGLERDPAVRTYLLVQQQALAR